MIRLIPCLALLAACDASAADPTVLDLWPGKPPGETKDLPPETDIWKDTDKLVGDRRIQKITNVSKPTLAVYRPEKAADTGAAVIVCPGGGHRILAYDHEGTEVAEWLAKNGVTGIVLKYRVPARDENKRWQAAVQDAQRAVRVVRDKAGDWGIDPKRIGILGFSAGGETAGLAAILHGQSQYEAVDKADKASGRPDFAALIYPGGLLERGNTKLREYVKVDKDTPPMFLAHAFDDPVDPRNSLLLATELKAVGVSCELHMYATGGHGYGMRNTGHPVNAWPQRCLEWMTKQGYVKK
ncbi:MAG TPA: alpha/beta hydrolase [Gemmataceae bacterium]|nr:alpha/beta hydrolase [Gemmataceae bacterium]